MAEIPKGKWRRSAIGGKTAAHVGGKLMGYYAKRPFLSDAGRSRARERMEEENAAIVFQGLSLLKGTAVKIAQMLSNEMDVFPPSVCRELAKSYNQVPPMNRAMVRKTVGNAFGSPLEKVFKSFDTQAFAAASLGQVHRAVAKDDTLLAVKVQYPGIGQTIRADMQMVRQMLRPMAEYNIILPALEEIEQRLAEEIDYGQEAAHVAWFGKRIPENGYGIPEVKKELCRDAVLSLTLMEGLPLNKWLKTEPAQDARDKVAQHLYDWFLYCFYDLHCIHADPNPGNFIIDDNLNVGIVDFGCVRRFESTFVEEYRALIRALLTKDREAHLRLFRKFDLIRGELDPDATAVLNSILLNFGEWFGQLFAGPIFDFGANPKFMQSAKAISQGIYKLRGHMKMNANFVFLDRTRYGLLRLFEQVRARVRVQNAYEGRSLANKSI